MDKFIMADGCALRVRDSVKGAPTVLLLHGYFETMEVWEDFIPMLGDVRTVAVDLPGHGISEIKGPVHTMEFLARTVHAALVELGVERCFMVGHSMGGYVALELLRLFPGSCRGIVLLHSTSYADTPEKKEARQREIDLVLQGRKELIARTNSAARFAPENRRRMRDEIEGLAEMVFLLEDDGICALLRGMMERRDNSDTLKDNPVPQLFIFGRGDEHIPAETAARMISEHPGSRVVWLEHSGHMGFMEEPERTAEAISAFIGSKE